MTKCTNSTCNSERIFSIGGKTSDMFGLDYAGNSHDGYVPSGMGFGGGDYIRMRICADCGTIQNWKPIPDSRLKNPDGEDDE